MHLHHTDAWGENKPRWLLLIPFLVCVCARTCVCVCERTYIKNLHFSFGDRSKCDTGINLVPLWQFLLILPLIRFYSPIVFSPVPGLWQGHHKPAQPSVTRFWWGEGREEKAQERRRQCVSCCGSLQGGNDMWVDIGTGRTHDAGTGVRGNAGRGKSLCRGFLRTWVSQVCSGKGDCSCVAGEVIAWVTCGLSALLPFHSLIPWQVKCHPCFIERGKCPFIYRQKVEAEERSHLLKVAQLVKAELRLLFGEPKAQSWVMK